MQVDLWQSHESENVTLIESLLAALDSATLTGADKTIFNCRVIDIARDVQADIDICHHSLSLDVTHTNKSLLQRSPSLVLTSSQMEQLRQVGMSHSSLPQQ